MSADPGRAADPSLRLEGERIYLRRVEVSDASERYVHWLNDPETYRYLESGGGATLESIAEYIRQYEGRDDALFLAIVLKDGDQHVGNIKLEPISSRHRHAVLGIMIGAAEARGKGIGTEAVLLLLRHAFRTLKMHRVSLGVCADNASAIRCYRRIGFVEEGRLRDSTLRDTGYVDGVWMSILEDEYEALYAE